MLREPVAGKPRKISVRYPLVLRSTIHVTIDTDGSHLLKTTQITEFGVIGLQLARNQFVVGDIRELGPDDGGLQVDEV